MLKLLYIPLPDTFFFSYKQIIYFNNITQKITNKSGIYVTDPPIDLGNVFMYLFCGTYILYSRL